MMRSKDKKISVRLSNELYLEIKKKAAEKETVMSTAIRKLIAMSLEDNKIYVDAVPMIDELHVFGGVMSRIGGNLNQLAHYFNMSETVNETELEIAHKALTVQFTEIAILIKQIKRSLIDERERTL